MSCLLTTSPSLPGGLHTARATSESRPARASLQSRATTTPTRQGECHRIPLMPSSFPRTSARWNTRSQQPRRPAQRHCCLVPRVSVRRPSDQPHWETAILEDRDPRNTQQHDTARGQQSRGHSGQLINCLTNYILYNYCVHHLELSCTYFNMNSFCGFACDVAVDEPVRSGEQIRL